MIYTIGLGRGRKQVKLSTLQAIATALDIGQILDWRRTTSDALTADTLRETFNNGQRYSFVGDRCNAENITERALNRLATIEENVLLLFDEPIPGSCTRHQKLALVLEQRNVPVSHIVEEEIVRASELQRAIDQDDTYECETWRPDYTGDVDVTKPIELPAEIKAKTKKPVLKETAVCVAISLHSFGNTRKLPKEELAEAINKDRTEEDKIKSARIGGHKKLLLCPELDALNSHDSAIRAYIKYHSMPSPLGARTNGGLYFVGKSIVLQFDKRLMELLEEREKRYKRDLIRAYPQRKREAEAELGSDYRESDYATVEELEQTITHEVQYLEFSDAPGMLKELSADLFQREQAKIQTAVAQAEENCRMIMRLEMMQVVDNMLAKLQPDVNGKQKIIKTVLTAEDESFIKTFDGRNLTNDVQLKALQDRLNRILKGVDTEALKDDRCRQYIQTGFNQVKAALSTLVVDKPTRKYNL